MAVASTTYAPRRPGESALYQVVRDHVDAFRAEAGRLRDGEGLPRFVEQEFRAFLRCGWLAGGFARLRYQIAWDHGLCRAVVRAFLQAVLGWLRRRARRAGVADGRGGAVVVIQRFGGSLNLNVHLHALMLDGVFAKDEDGRLTFHPARPLTALDVDEVLATVEARVGALLDRRGFGAGHAEGAESDA